MAAMKMTDVRSYYYQRVLGLSDLWMRPQTDAPKDLVKGVHVIYAGPQSPANAELLKKMIDALKRPDAVLQSQEKMSAQELEAQIQTLKVTTILVFGTIDGFGEVKPGQVLDVLGKKIFFTHSPEVLLGDSEPVKMRKRETWAHMQLLLRELN